MTCLMCLGSGHQSWWRWPVTITPITGDVITGAHLHDDYDVTNNNSGDRQKLLFVVQSAIPPPTCPPVLPTWSQHRKSEMFEPKDCPSAVSQPSRALIRFEPSQFCSCSHLTLMREVQTSKQCLTLFGNV